MLCHPCFIFCLSPKCFQLSFLHLAASVRCKFPSNTAWCDSALKKNHTLYSLYSFWVYICLSSLDSFLIYICWRSEVKNYMDVNDQLDIFLIFLNCSPCLVQITSICFLLFYTGHCNLLMSTSLVVWMQIKFKLLDTLFRHWHGAGLSY